MPLLLLAFVVGLVVGPVLWVVYGMCCYRRAVRESDHFYTNSEAGIW